MTLPPILSALGIESASVPERFAVVDVERASFADLSKRLVEEMGLPLSLMYATDERSSSGSYGMYAVFAVDETQDLLTLRTRVPAEDPHYPSLTVSIMAAHWYERLIQDQFGIVADGHPDPRRLMHHQNIPAGTFPLRKDFAWNTVLSHANEPDPMHVVTGQGVYEIPVGPIHAGVIEPGHFRFHVRGERILTLEGKLFFTHKGVEKMLEGKTPIEAMPFVERVSGDMAIGHSVAFAEAVERALGVQIPERARVLRTILNEWERITAHVFDIGNMGGNGTGFSFMAAQGFRLVERMRRVHQDISGHRFLRGVIVPGGLAQDIADEHVKALVAEVGYVEQEMKKILDIAYASDGLMERFETTGVLSHAAALAYGALGTPARASGVGRDLRRDRPFAGYEGLSVGVVTEKTGDVRARVDVRARELKESFRLIRLCFARLTPGPVAVALPAERSGSAYGWCEAWRGEILDWVRLDDHGRIDRCVIRDPSFCNWALFGEIGPGNIVPDFPLCNKSLNLSYSGTDL